MGPGGLPPQALAGALEQGAPTAGAAPLPPGGPPGGSPGTPPMTDEVAVGVMKKHNIGPDDLPVIASAAAHIMQKMGMGAVGGPPPGPPPGAPPMPPGPPGVA